MQKRRTESNRVNTTKEEMKRRTRERVRDVLMQSWAGEEVGGRMSNRYVVKPRECMSEWRMYKVLT